MATSEIGFASISTRYAMSKKVERLGNVEVVSRPVHVPHRLLCVPNLRAIPESFEDEPVIYALCTERRVAPGRVEGEALYVGLTDDLDRRRSEHRAAFFAEGREPFVVTLWWPHPTRWAVEHGVTARIAEEAFLRYLLPRYNRPRESRLTGQHRKALRLHGVQ